MSFDDDFIEDMPSTVVIEPWQSGDAYSKPTYGAAVSYRCRLEAGAHRILDANGQEVVSMTRLFLAGSFAISTKDRLTMPAGTIPSRPPIKRVDQVHDEEGPHHTVVHI